MKAGAKSNAPRRRFESSARNTDSESDRGKHRDSESDASFIPKQLALPAQQ